MPERIVFVPADLPGLFWICHAEKKGMPASRPPGRKGDGGGSNRWPRLRRELRELRTKRLFAAWCQPPTTLSKAVAPASRPNLLSAKAGGVVSLAMVEERKHWQAATSIDGTAMVGAHPARLLRKWQHGRHGASKGEILSYRFGRGGILIQTWRYQLGNDGSGTASTSQHQTSPACPLRHQGANGSTGRA